jgi:hypothetical protein
MKAGGDGRTSPRDDERRRGPDKRGAPSPQPTGETLTAEEIAAEGVGSARRSRMP